LTFIAEIDCGQLPSDALSMPRTGTLSFFYWDGQIDGETPWRGAPENRGAARVVYMPVGTLVSECDPPAGIAPYDLVELTGELFTTGTTWDSPVFREEIGDLGDDQAFMKDWSNGDAFRHALWELAPSPPDHRLGGHSKPIQDSSSSTLPMRSSAVRFPTVTRPCMKRLCAGPCSLSSTATPGPE
jgi:hypothetical protein